MSHAGLLAKKAVEAGLQTRPYIKTSLSPGSGVVTDYLVHSGVQPFLDQLGFSLVGYGCMTCIGNSGELPEAVHLAIGSVKLQARQVALAAGMSSVSWVTRRSRQRVGSFASRQGVMSAPVASCHGGTPGSGTGKVRMRRCGLMVLGP